MGYCVGDFEGLIVFVLVGFLVLCVGYCVGAVVGAGVGVVGARVILDSFPQITLFTFCIKDCMLY